MLMISLIVVTSFDYSGCFKHGRARQFHGMERHLGVELSAYI
ncbi:MAG: hypothetical protein V7746_08150 [Halioglobus sp.]